MRFKLSMHNFVSPYFLILENQNRIFTHMVKMLIKRFDLEVNTFEGEVIAGRRQVVIQDYHDYSLKSNGTQCEGACTILATRSTCSIRNISFICKGFNLTDLWKH